MEADYRSAMTDLFPSTQYSQTGIIGNVFQDALNNQNGGGAGDPTSDGNNGNGNQDNGSNSGDGGNENGGNNGNNGNGGDNGSGGDQPPPPPPPPPPASSVEEGFLILSPPQAGNPLEILHRATRDPDGYFILDDGSRIEVLSGLVGFPQDMLVLPQDTILMTKSSTQPQVLKVILIQGFSQGTSVVGYLDDQGQQKFWFNATMLYERTLSAVLYDVNDDGEEELVCTFASNPNLVVYQIAGNDINYLRELTLPFKPAALVTTERTTPIDVRYLQVFDSTLKRSVTFSSQFSGVYSFSTPPTYEGKVSLDTTPGSIPSASFTAFVYNDRVVLFQRQGTEVALIASLSTSSGFPRLVVGDYSGDETRQTVFLP